ncbi:proline betaine transporter [Staphylococcus gallinarum]|uniref:Proline betaine transporter n=1 Tax=Staphylococcus gallinarum TaxID=1293 RepID=A0A380FC23_STAGA|nr:proline betaine transporter [Staphylococcus gallinarum]
MDYDKDFDKSNINKVDPKAAKKNGICHWYLVMRWSGLTLVYILI